MNSDIRKAIMVINQRIENLERIKSLLAEEFGPSPVISGKSVAVTISANDNRHVSVKGNRKGATRKDELVKFLVANGPSKRAKILAETGMPKGTVAFLLNDSAFVRRSDGTWDVSGRSSATQETTH